MAKHGGATLVRPRTSARGRGARVALLSALLVLGAVLVLALAHRRRAAVPAEPLLWIDPASAALEQAPEWTDPRWLERLQATLVRCAPFPVEDAAALDVLRGELVRLSFVHRVRRLAVDPGGKLAIELDLRRPVACVPAGDSFVLVAADGVLLDGLWPVPPRLGAAFLPVIGPMRERRDLFAAARAGDSLAEPEHRDALDVAVSLAAHLDEQERARLGRVVIDASGRSGAGGARIELEDARVALFGRAPSCGEPGELPAEHKWRALARALALLDDGAPGHDWQLVDLRWDRPDLALRGSAEPVLAHASDHAVARAFSGATDSMGGARGDASGGRGRASGGGGARDERPRVR